MGIRIKVKYYLKKNYKCISVGQEIIKKLKMIKMGQKKSNNY